jgi:hypothetical protein
MIAISAVILLLAIAYLSAVSWIESRQATRLNSMQPDQLKRASISRTAVVYFSRSGNTALAARHIAKRLNAALFSLTAPDYQLGTLGLVHAIKDANARRAKPDFLPEINPSTLDLTPFDTVYLGSPVWLYSPAPPIWAFVEHNRFDGQHVVLCNTFNSHIGEDYIAKLKDKVMARGAKSFEHRRMLRGRMMQQISPEQMIQAIDREWFNH